MKNTTIFTCLLLAAVFYACKKGSKNTNEPAANTPHLIQFNTSGFTASVGSITAGNSTKLKVNSIDPQSFSDSVKYILYLLVDSKNNTIRNKIYKYDSAGFGTIKDSIAPGTYTAIFAASPLGFDSAYGTFNSDQLRYDVEYGNFLPAQFPPILFKKLSLTVGPTNTTQSVVLTRITAQLQVIIKDAFPANASYIKVKADGDMSYYSCKLEQPVLETMTDYTGTVHMYNVPLDQTVNTVFAGTTNFATSPISILNTLTPMTVTIGVYNVKDIPIAVKTIGNITFQRNTRTILSGNMFTNSTSGSGFDVHFISGFSDSTTVHF